MTQKQKALSRLAQLALNAASALPSKERQAASLSVAEALHDELPDFAQIARSHAALIAEESNHFDHLFQSLDS